MKEWEDYYEILGVSPNVSQKEIKKAYRENAFIYHPDRMQGLSESVRHRAEEKMKKAIQAYKVLSNPQKRQQYHSEWLRKKGGTVTAQQGYQVPKPKPVVDLSVIRFTNVTPNTVRIKSFIIRNEGGPWSTIWVDNPKSWMEITNYTSLSDSDELPLRVEIKAEGKDWGKTYSEVIRVHLDNEETQVKVQLRTKSKPVRKRTYARQATYAGPIPQPSVGGYVGGIGSTSAPPKVQSSFSRPRPTPLTSLPSLSRFYRLPILGISVLGFYLYCITRDVDLLDLPTALKLAPAFKPFAVEIATFILFSLIISPWFMVLAKKPLGILLGNTSLIGGVSCYAHLVPRLIDYANPTLGISFLIYWVIAVIGWIVAFALVFVLPILFLVKAFTKD